MVFFLGMFFKKSGRYFSMLIMLYVLRKCRPEILFTIGSFWYLDNFMENFPSRKNLYRGFFFKKEFHLTNVHWFYFGFLFSARPLDSSLGSRQSSIPQKLWGLLRLCIIFLKNGFQINILSVYQFHSEVFKLFLRKIEKLTRE